MFCTKRRSLIKDGDKFCINCGKENARDHTYCKFCGTSQQDNGIINTILS